MPTLGAGASATEHYEALRKDWLHRKRRVFTVVAIIPSLIVLAANLVMSPHGGVWTWNAGLLTGMALAFWVWARQSPPAFVEHWLEGAWGEQRTAKALKTLPPEWTVLHDLPTGDGGTNIDHLVIGPGGVFLLDSKHWQGQVTVVGDTAFVQQPLRDTVGKRDVAPAVKALAAELSQRVRTATRIFQFVTPVVVVWGELNDHAAGDKCYFVAGEHLTEWLQQRPTTVAPNRLAQVTAAFVQQVSSRDTA
ncbi:MAG: nuclease-related domain-containing protein [Dermatophilaceae bacterium]|jgi:hypothetical protein